MKKYSLLLLCIFICFHSFSQSDAEEFKEHMIKHMYTSTKAIFIKDTFLYKEVAYMKSDYFNEPSNEIEADACLKRMKETGRLSIQKKSGASCLFFSAVLTDKYRKRISDQLIVDVHSNNLTNAKGQSVELTRIIGGGMGYGELDIHTQLSNQTQDTTNITGSIVYDVSFLKGYDVIQLTPKDTGRVFKLNGCTYTFHSVVHNKLLLEKHDTTAVSLSVLNYTESDYVVTSYSYNELTEMKKIVRYPPVSINLKAAFNKNIAQHYRSMVTIFEDEPSISYEAFKQKLSPEFMNALKTDHKYIVSTSQAEYAYRFTVYAPVYEIRTVEIFY